METHLTNILNKLGVNSRTQLARWVKGADYVGGYEFLTMSLRLPRT